MASEQLTILGVGLLGGSIGLAARARSLGYTIAGYGHRPETLRQAKQMGAIDVAFDDPVAATRGASLVILCTPVGLFETLLKALAPVATESMVWTDVGSTKQSTVLAAQRHLPFPRQFVGSHPMAGSEKRGVEFARADLFQNAQCLLTPTADTAPAALAKVSQFWRDLGMRLTTLTPERHDELLADISHFPHLLAALLVDMQSPESLNLCGKGFLDTTRIASGDGGLWRDILVDNKHNIRRDIATLREKLGHVEQLLDRPTEMADWLNAVARVREDLLLQKLRAAGGGRIMMPRRVAGGPKVPAL